ncbi:MAG: NAD(P)H-quinone dehydrogenase [Euzebyales bacterium]|nr:NAD(P)H-quinone dehydrogenase [Euzebyales bacterium]
MAAPLRVVIVGGGPGGYEAALVAAEHGADVTVVSDEGLGGNSVLWDCVPSKAMIVSAEAMGWMQSAHRLGVRHPDGADIASKATVDMAAVMDRVQHLAADQSADIAKKVGASGVRTIEGRGRLVDAGTVAVGGADGGGELPADVVLVATGSRPRVLPFSSPDGERVFTSRELFGLRTLPERLIVVGSGATGAEYAHAFARFGSEVHLISSRDQVLPGEDPDAAAVIEDSFERWGAVIHRKRRAVDLERTGDGVRVRIGDRSSGGPAGGPDGDEWVEGTHALFCIGQVPQTDGLGLDGVGVELAEGGAVTVDGVSRSNVHTLYAAGDVTGRMMLASVAAMQGRNAMWHALGSAVEPIRWDAVAACVFTDPEVASVGVSPRSGGVSQVPMRTVCLPFSGNPRAKMSQATDGFVKLHAMQGSGTVLGGTVVSRGASDLVMPISVAVKNRLTVSQIANSFSIYPSMSGSLQETARLLMGEPTGHFGPT